MKPWHDIGWWEALFGFLSGLAANWANRKRRGE